MIELARESCPVRIERIPSRPVQFPLTRCGPRDRSSVTTPTVVADRFGTVTTKRDRPTVAPGGRPSFVGVFETITFVGFRRSNSLRILFSDLGLFREGLTASRVETR